MQPIISISKVSTHRYLGHLLWNICTVQGSGYLVDEEPLNRIVVVGKKSANAQFCKSVIGSYLSSIIYVICPLGLANGSCRSNIKPSWRFSISLKSSINEYLLFLFFSIVFG